MKQNSIYFFLTMFFIGSITLFTSCNDDDDVVDEWAYNRVYLQTNDYESGVKIFNLTHDAEKIQGDEISIVFNVKMQKPINEDLIVYLKAESETENLNEEDILFSSKQAVIKSGEKISEEITVTVDHSTFSTIEDKISVSFSIVIEKIETSDKNTIISNNLRFLSGLVNKTALLNLKTGTPTESKIVRDKTQWDFVFMEGVENPNSNSVAGTGNSDVATNGVPFWLTVDFKEVKTITGIQTKHWGSTYAPKSIEVYTSNDGETWKSLGVLDTGGSQTQNITFITPLQTRYLKYQMLTVPNRVDITYFYIYIPAD
ncbi:MAG: hypothetical protein GX963_00880 [Bacteroidales bacterium]|nr:hypothetical protein [Bacteroidales bacterium]